MSRKALSASAAANFSVSANRAGEHARNFLGTWNGKLVCDDFAGYKAGFERGITEIGCLAHARRKFFACMWRTKADWPDRRCTQSEAYTRLNGRPKR